MKLAKLFGFQKDNAKNMYDFLMKLLDSRAARMNPEKALNSLHADYIGGDRSNYKKWYFGAEMDIEDSLSIAGKDTKKMSYDKYHKDFPLDRMMEGWVQSMKELSAYDRIIHLGIYLMIWGEANNLRFMPECICFLTKCCIDIFYSIDFSKEVSPLAVSFLDHAITPLYNFYHDQLYEKVGERYLLKIKDHSKIIGYDDINQTFWYRKSMERIILRSKKLLLNIKPQERYLYLDQINWEKSVRKTYYEYRSWFHAVVNFNRVWNIHIGVFWYYTCLNCKPLYTVDYDVTTNNSPPLSTTFSILSLAGSGVCTINFIGLLSELCFVPRSWPGAVPITNRLLFIITLFLLNSVPTVCIIAFNGLSNTTSSTLAISIVQLLFSIFTVIYCSLVPLAKLTYSPFKERRRKRMPGLNFTDSVCKLEGKRQISSYGLWIGVFTSKLLESYFFLTLSLKDPVRELSIIKVDGCVRDSVLGSFFCMKQPILVMGLLFATSIILFFLDTYLWYIIWNTSFSVCRSFLYGVSIWTPWKNVFGKLPQRIASKILTPSCTMHASEESKKRMVSRIWNAVVISLYREHLISIDHLEHLIYQISKSETEGSIIEEPLFFLEKEDRDNLGLDGDEMLSNGCEASRRLSFFAQSLSTPMPKPPNVQEMPSFSVLIPHYAETIILSLHDIIRREDNRCNITLLEYLKNLYSDEWHNFVRDTKLLSTEKNEETEGKPSTEIDSGDLSYYTVGFKTATPEYILRTRIWASLRSQTLFRTISGFMNYSRAIKLLFTTETNKDFDDDNKKVEEANVLALQKFRIVVSLQKLATFNKDQLEATELLIRTYPEIQICYLDWDIDPVTKKRTYYSALIDGSSSIQANGKRKPKYRIRLSGNPILGDGKSDNQNHAIIFCRGEYCQLIDANQDNYLQECLKIRSMLMEFEETILPEDVYKHQTDPVAIVGMREYIFSENIGVLGDIAAGKEQTFGTLSARTNAFIGGKLHYGHPDLLNTIFMASRGGFSKSQRGLHLNEDIYAGINALIRSGRIKHCEYMQCGKGRDLGFNSILNFSTKIGSGMSEQMLSREYFYLGTQLPIDRFLSFYYAHPGFQMNNAFIILSLKCFMLFCISIAVLANNSIICSYDRNIPITDKRKPNGCYNLIPIINWIQRCVFSIFIVFGISFLPLCVQELMEKGLWDCILRIGRHFISLSPMFEVFVCRIYSRSLVKDFTRGGAKYIATGRGFSTNRIHFYKLYSRYSQESFYLAMGMLLMLLYTSMVIWKFGLVYFWCTVFSLLFSPFWFNPNQFDFMEFFIDYQRFLKWLLSGNVHTKEQSWLAHARDIRMKSTGTKRRKYRVDSNNPLGEYKRPSFISGIITEIIPTLLSTIIISIAYMFESIPNRRNTAIPLHFSFLRLLVIAYGPILMNMVTLAIFFPISLIVGPILSRCTSQLAGLTANIVHLMSVVYYLIFVDILFLCEDSNPSRTVLGICAACSIQNLTSKLVIHLVLNREFRIDSASICWWKGTWMTSKLGWHILTQPLREFACKTIEMSLFACDFLLSHFLLLIQFPVLFIPYINKIHSFLLLWMRSDGMIEKPIYSTSKRRRRARQVVTYFLIFLLVNAAIISTLLAPYIANTTFNVEFRQYVPEAAKQLIQPIAIDEPVKGIKGYIPYY